MANKEVSKYTTDDLLKSVNKLLKFSQDEKMDPAIFLHSLIFTSEFMIKKFNFIPKQVAEIRRQSREIIAGIDAAVREEKRRENKLKK
ncbi:MAG: hypothetical protein QHH19_02585 [Candidatus Thermoplasmatota archaeon]|jgi:hypothetical protein|nr:hypothetical protein [Candidatus Thermoplasmatota archaeon]